MWGPENRCSQVRETVISFPSHSALLWLRRAMSRWRSGPQGWASANPTLEYILTRSFTVRDPKRFRLPLFRSQLKGLEAMKLVFNPEAQ